MTALLRVVLSVLAFYVAGYLLPTGCITAMFVLGLIIAIHEAGHLMAAILVGIKVHEYAIFFGPALFKWRWRGIDMKVGSLPLGGYVRPDETGLKQAGGKQQLLFFSGGLIFNLLSGWAVLTTLLLIKGAPVAKALGVPALLLREMAHGIALTFWEGTLLRDASGPVGIVTVGGNIAAAGGGYAEWASFFVMLSFCGAIMNALPFLPLDGGHILFGVLKTMGIQVKEGVKIGFALVGFLLLMGLTITLTVKDVSALL